MDEQWAKTRYLTNPSEEVVLTVISSAGDFWRQIVVPDCSDAQRQRASLRANLHAMISLYHVVDWVHRDAKRLQALSKVYGHSALSGYRRELFAACEAFWIVDNVANAGKHGAKDSAKDGPISVGRLSAMSPITVAVGGSVASEPLGVSPVAAFGTETFVKIIVSDGRAFPAWRLIDQVRLMWEGEDQKFGLF